MGAIPISPIPCSPTYRGCTVLNNSIVNILLVAGRRNTLVIRTNFSLRSPKSLVSIYKGFGYIA